jgi:hypothetical protein
MWRARDLRVRCVVALSSATGDASEYGSSHGGGGAGPSLIRASGTRSWRTRKPEYVVPTGAKPQVEWVE